MKNVFLFFLITFTIISTKVFTLENKSEIKFIGCNNSISKDDLNLDLLKIKKIEIDVHKYRDWTVNGIRILTNRSRFVTEEYKEDLMQQLPLIMIVGLNVFFQLEYVIVETKKTT